MDPLAVPKPETPEEDKQKVDLRQAMLTLGDGRTSTVMLARRPERGQAEVWTCKYLRIDFFLFFAILTWNIVASSTYFARSQ